MEQFDYSDVEKVDIQSNVKDELCVIMYSAEYTGLIGLFVALLQRNELSQRALAVTTAVIETVPALYTAWNYRFEICCSLYNDDAALWEKELDWLDELTLSNPKNYQIWSYRQALIQRHPRPNFVRELPILDLMIDDDTKNYHVWSYRKWTVKHFDEWSHELAFVNKYLDRDVYNNSAWTHRAFYLRNVDVSEELINAEVEFCKAKITIAPQNVSPWNYVRFLYSKFRNDQYDESILNFASDLVDHLLDDEETQQKSPKVLSSFALELLADVYAKTDVNKSIRAYKALADEWDSIRRPFWNLRLKKLTT